MLVERPVVSKTKLLQSELLRIQFSILLPIRNSISFISCRHNALAFVYNYINPHNQTQTQQ